MSISPAFLDELKAALGPGGWTQDPEVVAPFLTEWRNRWTGDTPILLIVAVTGLAVLSPEWGFSDFVAEGSEPAELDARIRILARSNSDPDVLTAGPIRVDGAAYSASVDGEPLDLTYTEFELLKYLAQHPGRVFSRETLLSDVWGYDYYGGTRTVDVHVRRLRAKLGVEHESLIGTVRNVGYRFSPDSSHD